MHRGDENGMVYYINMPLLKKAREKAIRDEAEAIDRQISQAEHDLDLVKAADTALHKIQLILEEMRKIAVEAAQNPNADRKALNKKLNFLKKQIDEIVNSATVGGVNLIDGSMDKISGVIKAITDAIKGDIGN